MNTANRLCVGLDRTQKVCHLYPQKIRSHLKNNILVQGQGGADVQPAGILKYSEELKRGPNKEIGSKGFFEMASK